MEDGVEVRLRVPTIVWAEIKAEATRRRCKNNEIALDILCWAVKNGWQYWKKSLEGAE